MKTIQLFGALCIVLVLTSGKTPEINGCRNSGYILNQLKNEYHYAQNWTKAELQVHIQEPRVGVPLRYTRLVLNNEDNYFSMERNRDEGLEFRILTSNGESEITFNGDPDIPEEIIDKYALDAERSEGYRRFYRVLLGIPMSLNEELLKKAAPAQSGTFEGKKAYEIDVELKEEIISKYWTLIISEAMDDILALEFNHPGQAGHETEIIKFHDRITIDSINIPWIRHWYLKDTNEYLG